MHIFRRIFLSNYWWLESDIWSQASYRNAILWEAFLDPSDSYFLFAENSCWEKCDEKYAYMFNVYKNQQNRQTGSRNLMGPKTLSTIFHTNMKIVTKYQISAINSCWEKCDKKWILLFQISCRQICWRYLSIVCLWRCQRGPVW
jgi:hypothetical protein